MVTLLLPSLIKCSVAVKMLWRMNVFSCVVFSYMMNFLKVNRLFTYYLFKIPLFANKFQNSTMNVIGDDLSKEKLSLVWRIFLLSCNALFTESLLFLCWHEFFIFLFLYTSGCLFISPSCRKLFTFFRRFARWRIYGVGKRYNCDDIIYSR